MRIIIKLLSVCLFVSTLISCEDNTGTDYFSRKSNNLKGQVKSFNETVSEYAKNKKSTKEIRTGETVFDLYGKTVSYKNNNTPEKTSYSETYIYNSKGKLENIEMSANYKDFTPVFSKKNKLTSYSYTKIDDGNVYSVEISYTDSGRIAQETYIRNNISYASQTYQYENGILVGSIYEINRQETISKYDNSENIITQETFDENKKSIAKYSYAYTFDEQGNWITQTKYSGKEPLTLLKRTITYFTENELAALTPAGNISAKSFSVSSYFSDLSERLFGKSELEGTPTMILMIVLLTLSLGTLLLSLFKIKRIRTQFNNFGGVTHEIGKSGFFMKRIWMYNKEPYVKIALFFVVALCSFIAVIATLFLVGGIVLVFFWLINILLNILVWIGVIGTIFGVLAIFGGAILPGILVLIPCAIIWANDDAIERAGRNLVEAGINFMRDLNLFEWGINLFSNYWDVMLLVFVFPLILFICFALILVVLDLILIGIELLITRIYNVRRPCPYCGSTKESDYLVEGSQHIHPVKLRPGVYGTFSQRSPINASQTLPTMLINGRWKLKRKCSNCSKIITSKITDGSNRVGFGTEIHIGFVGHRSSGKSTLMYSGLGLLLSNNKDRLSQIDANLNDEIAPLKIKINSGQKLAPTTDTDNKAVQLIYTDKLRPVPYHLYFYDVAGEKFDAASKSHLKNMDFYRNVQSVVFLIDPCMIEFNGIPVSEELIEWVNGYEKTQSNEKYDIENTFSIIKKILTDAGRNSKTIEFNFVCVKADLGYLEAQGYKPDKVKGFMQTELGLSNLINSAKNEFKHVRFFAVSALSDNQGLKSLFSELLKQQGVKI
jgi:hypothetical protein